MTTIEGVRCDKCGQPAEHVWRTPPSDSRERLCGECARYRGALDRGTAGAAFDTLGFAVSLARNVGVTDDQLREALEMILTDHAPSVDTYPCGVDGILGRDSREDRPWQWSGSWEKVA